MTFVVPVSGHAYLMHFECPADDVSLPVLEPVDTPAEEPSLEPSPEGE